MFDGTSHLTHREIDVIRLIAAGRSSKQIALALGIAPKTVESYVANARFKLGACNRPSLMARAAALGLIGPEDGGGGGE